MIDTIEKGGRVFQAGSAAVPVVTRRVLVYDHAGHAFPVQLSRWLADHGHHVRHVYCSDVEAPRGPVTRAPDDPPRFDIESVSLGRVIAKYAFVRRWVREWRIGDFVARRVRAYRPDVVLCANAPPALVARLAARLRHRGTPLVVWVQDIFTPGAEKITAAWPWLPRLLARKLVARSEFGAFRSAAALIVISPDFLPVLRRHDLAHPACSVIENWAPLGGIMPRPKDNPWSRRHGLADRFVFLFSGTLGLKHNPEHLANIARAFRDDDGVRVVVVSQGLGRRHLEAVKAREDLDGLVLLDFQPYEDLSDTLAAADVAVVLLEPFAGGLSVPSKVYSYFCAERPILGAVPAGNLAHRLIEGVGAGLCVDPDDIDGFVSAARRLRDDRDLRTAFAKRQAAHAATAFDMDKIGPRFEAVLERATKA